MKMSDSLCKTADFADVVNPYCDSVCKGLKVDEKNGGSTCLSAETTKELQATLVALFSFYHYHWNEKSDKILILP